MKTYGIAISIALLLAVSGQAQEPDCVWWDPPTDEPWKTATVESVTTCLKAGADPNARDEEGKTPWDLAQENEKLKGSAAYWKLNTARRQR